ncbi:copper resistance CopC family protein [Marinobacterium litorale]|uniref:copper resistance CopC family protein n=1 Tax=Marinobacterium litorale TaxID=404770 RepID=UPI00040CFE6F|nr:copper resistance CopC family protein [Marinobacterium litorale]
MSLATAFKALALSLTFSVSASVFAHTGLKESSPGQGAVVTEPVGEITLSFTGPVRLVKVEMISVDAGAVDLDFLPSIGPGTDFEVGVPPLQPGQYRVDWMAMGADGHKITGQFEFSRR